MANTILKAGDFALIQGNTFIGGKPVINLKDNKDGTYTIDVSYSITFKPDVPVSASDVNLKNSSKIDYAAFPGKDGDISNQNEVFCEFGPSTDGIVFESVSIELKGAKINHGS